MKKKNIIAVLAVLVLAAFSVGNDKNSTLYKDGELIEMERSVLFDTDANNELDDQHALAYLLYNADI